MHLHDRTCGIHSQDTDREVVISVDGVNETNSSSRSLEIVSVMFPGCKEVFPCLIHRPEPHQKKKLRHYFEVYLEGLLEDIVSCSTTIKKAVLDAPERAACRKQKQHGGYFSCDMCYANPENLASQEGRGSKLI